MCTAYEDFKSWKNAKNRYNNGWKNAKNTIYLR